MHTYMYIVGLIHLYLDIFWYLYISLSVDISLNVSVNNSAYGRQALLLVDKRRNVIC